MTARRFDMDSYPRKAHFSYFRAMENPCAGVTAKVDVTRLVSLCREGGFRFYPAMIHIACLAGNAVPEMRRRISGDGIVEYDVCGTSHIELTENGSYCYCTLFHDMPWNAYFSYAEEMRARCLQAPSIEEEPFSDALFFVTTLPWIHYEQIIMPIAASEASNPRFCWGKFEEDAKGRLMMPFTLVANHALADGVHFGRFFMELEERLQSKHF